MNAGWNRIYHDYLDCSSCLYHRFHWTTLWFYICYCLYFIRGFRSPSIQYMDYSNNFVASHAWNLFSHDKRMEKSMDMSICHLFIIIIASKMTTFGVFHYSLDTFIHIRQIELNIRIEWNSNSNSNIDLLRFSSSNFSAKIVKIRLSFFFLSVLFLFFLSVSIGTANASE